MDETTTGGGAANSVDLTRLNDLRGSLLRLHKLLLDGERADYEREHGRAAAGEMLRIVIEDERFAWLRRLSELIVRIDTMLYSKDEPATETDARAAFVETRALLSTSDDGDEFGTKYRAALQRDPAIVVAHAQASRLAAADR